MAHHELPPQNETEDASYENHLVCPNCNHDLGRIAVKAVKKTQFHSLNIERVDETIAKALGL
jgi:hypothetical protein